MEWYWAFALMIGMILALMAFGFPVALAFITANLIGAVIFMGGSGGILTFLGNAFESMTSFALAPVPLFLLMGELFFHTGLANRMFDAVDRLLGRVPGRLSYVTVAGGTAFATLSGSSMGSTALMGSLMVPEMTKRGYKKILSIGPILGTGGLAMIIPPSALGVLLATLAKIDVGKLLIAGVVPGLVLASMYAAMIFGITMVDKKAAPAYDMPPVALAEKLRMFLVNIGPMALVVVIVIAFMLLGWATPSEAAAVGVIGVLLLALAYRALTWKSLVKSVTGALRVTAMAFLIIFGSATFSQLLSWSGASSGLIGWVTGFDLAPLVMLLAMFGILLVLGMFMDQLSMMLLTIPIFYPLATLQLGFDPIWFGVVVLLALEISFTTPPFGLLLFVMKGVAPKGTTMAEIYVAAIPFMACAMLLVALLIIEPQIALWLPNLGSP
ncbi:TRAP transporter large permease subunit [Marinibaculum pumilum]|uniref:TRAP transporter large permease protein n=1 Tax=Marinibaculum pumilum TaxID=1766165 RepID=A0ABV7KYX3_9PROT